MLRLGDLLRTTSHRTTSHKSSTLVSLLYKSTVGLTFQNVYLRKLLHHLLCASRPAEQVIFIYSSTHVEVVIFAMY